MSPSRSSQKKIETKSRFAFLSREGKDPRTFKELTEAEVLHEENHQRGAMTGTLIELVLGALVLILVLSLVPGVFEFVSHQFRHGETKVVCWVIFGMFLVGLYFVFRTLTIINYENANLIDVYRKSRQFSLKPKAKIPFYDLFPEARFGMVFDKLDAFFRIAKDKGDIPHAALADISVARHYAQDEIPNFLANSMTMVGLIGTIIGLTGATGGMETIFGSIGDLGALKEGFQDTLTGIDVAFFTTLFGAVAMLVLKYFNIVARKARTAFLTELEEVMITEILPKIPRISFNDKYEVRSTK